MTCECEEVVKVVRECGHEHEEAIQYHVAALSRIQSWEMVLLETTHTFANLAICCNRI